MRSVHGIVGAALASISFAVNPAFARPWQPPTVQQINPAMSPTPVGWRVSLDSNRALIGGGDYSGGYGSANLIDANTGQQLRAFANPQPFVHADFGRALGLAGSNALIGADQGNATGFADDSGTAYIFDTSTGSQRFKLNASDPQRGAMFGQAVALSSKW